MRKIDLESVGTNLSGLAEKHYERLVNGNLKSPLTSLQELYDGQSDKFLKTLLKKILERGEFKKLIQASPEELDDLQKEYLANFPWLISQDKKPKEHRKAIFDAFRFENFRQSNAAVAFVQDLGIRACPYCNAQYVTTTKRSSNNKARALCHFDHIRPKEKFPFLSMSFFNLVPCCASCNMFKSDKTDKKLLDPYRDDLSQMFCFKSDALDVVEMKLNRNREIRVSLEPRLPYSETETKDHFEVFKLKEVYQEFKDTVEEIYAKSEYYNDSRREELRGLSEEWFGDGGIDRLIVGNYTQESDLNKRPLSKFMSDMAKDAGLT